VTEQIAAEIAAHGLMRFDAFMARALFDPQHGYYASGRARIGREGDFFTSVSVGRMLGRVLAEQCAEIWKRLGKPDEFNLVEQGANDGRLASDILDALHDNHAGCFFAVRLTFVEPFPNLAIQQKETLLPHSEKVRHVDSLDALPEFSGVHLTNEYADALPVRLFVRRGGRWLERHVAVRESSLVFDDLPPEDVPAALPSNVEDGYIAEFRPDASEWVAAIAKKLTRGAMLAIDYGFPRDQLYAPWRTAGTLSCYRSHRRDDNPLDAPGGKDITAHVDFTGLAEAGIDAGLDLAGFTDQYHFLVGAGTKLLMAMEAAPSSAQRDADLRALKSLLHPEVMGTQFKYLCLTRGIDLSTSLAGFRHSHPAARELNTSPSGMHRGTARDPSSPDR
jgi:SAM-dependent MidA family methyltransferase